MPLRVKALFAVGATLLALFLGLYMLTRLVVLASFREYEDQEARRTVQRVLAALHDDLILLKGTTRDWAGSDDTYRFVTDRNVEYRRSRLGDTTAINNRLSLMVYLDAEGRVAFEKAYDLSGRRPLTVPVELREHLTADRLLIPPGRVDGGTLGLLTLGRAVLLVSAEPILTSERRGPVRGTLIFGRPLDGAELRRLGQATLSSVEARRLDDPRLPAEVRELPVARGGGEPIVIRPVDAQQLAGYAVLRDVYGAPALVLDARIPREVHARARLALVYLLAALAVMGIGCGALVLLLLERGLLTRLRGLASAVERIARSGEVGTRVPTAGGDEVSRLGDAINELLRALERVGGEQRRAHLARQEVEAELGRDRTMEALGRLAGGLAQDFNNLLVVVTGRLAFLEKTLDPASDTLRQVQLIQRAAERAAALTQQLLAFGHRQGVGEHPTDLNALIGALESRLREVAGERVLLGTVLAPGLERAQMDPFQLEQVLLNLAANARDAMSDGGTLTLETRTVELDQAFVREHPGARPGPHVLLRVTDTGVGMDADTRARAFEPFFTTKGLGKGSGLGLATVYSIVKQAGGYVGVESAPGRGASFAIYLPVAWPGVAPAPEPRA